MSKPSLPDESLLRNAFEHAVDGILIIDKLGIIQHANPAAAALFSYEISDLLGQNVSMLMPQPHKEQHDAYLKRYVDGAPAKIIGIGREVMGKRSDGTLFPFRLSVSESAWNEKGPFFTGIIHDISELKIAEKKLMEANQLLEDKVKQRTEELATAVNRLLDSNKKLEKSQIKLKESLEKEKELGGLKTQFLTLASHEFRTPLTTISSSASLISRYLEKAENLDERIESKIEKHTDRVQRAVDSLNAILEDFLSIRKLESGKIEPRFDSFNILELGRECLETIRDSSIKEGTFRFVEELKGIPEIVSDKRIIENAIRNLLSNAIKYSDPPIDVELQLIREDAEILLCVKDKGRGIPESEIKHIGDRFYRASNHGEEQGTGLGIFILKQYCDLLGARFEFESTFGEGSRFCLHIPTDKQT